MKGICANSAQSSPVEIQVVIHQPFALLSRIANCTLLPMGGRASRIVAILALFTCLACPIIETFDNWDHTDETGNDTEYALVIVALCVGAAYSFVRFIFNSETLAFVAGDFFEQALKPLFGGVGFALPILDATGPPILALRI
jgi:hypothetical protein